jgi:hypothetical protein
MLGTATHSDVFSSLSPKRGTVAGRSSLRRLVEVLGRAGRSFHRGQDRGKCLGRPRLAPDRFRKALGLLEGQAHGWPGSGWCTARPPGSHAPAAGTGGGPLMQSVCRADGASSPHRIGKLRRKCDRQEACSITPPLFRSSFVKRFARLRHDAIAVGFPRRRLTLRTV